MDVVKGAALIMVGITVGLAGAWLLPRGSATNEAPELATHLADLDRRLTRLERTLSDGAAHSPSGTSPQVNRLQESVSQLQEQLTSLTHTGRAPAASASPGAEVVSMSPGAGARQPKEEGIVSGDAEPRTPGAGIDPKQLAYVVTEALASLAPKYLEEQVSQLYAAQKEADQEAQREAEQRRRDEQQERRLARLVSDLYAFVPALSPGQAEEVGQVLREQWEFMGTMQQQAEEPGTVMTRGDILQQARELTDEKLYAILSPPQVDAFRLWRETRFGTPASVSRQ